MTYRLTLELHRERQVFFGSTGKQTIVTRIAGCRDEQEARDKAKGLYPELLRVKKVEVVK